MFCVSGGRGFQRNQSSLGKTLQNRPPAHSQNVSVLTGRNRFSFRDTDKGRPDCKRTSSIVSATTGKRSESGPAGFVCVSGGRGFRKAQWLPKKPDGQVGKPRKTCWYGGCSWTCQEEEGVAGDGSGSAGPSEEESPEDRRRPARRRRLRRLR